jgi:glycosyltransferase involved in cell wall biosynthesis
MKFSVVIPTYNRADLVQQALQSVLSQTFQDFEILIIDDGSQEPISLSSVDDRTRIIRHEKNLGAAAARNTGIMNAKGEIVAFLDSDDLWFPQKLEKQAELMKDLSIDASVTSFERDFEGSHKVVILRKPQSWIRELLMSCNQAPGTTLAVRRRCYAIIGLYDTNFPRHEDYDWLLRFVQTFNLDIVRYPLARVRVGGAPASSLVERSNIMLIARYRHLFLSQGRFLGTRAIGRRYLETSVSFSLEKNKPLALKYLWSTLMTNPVQHLGMYWRILENLAGFSFYPRMKKSWFNFFNTIWHKKF